MCHNLNNKRDCVCVFSARTTMPLSNETPVTSPRHSIHHSDSMNSRSPHDHARNMPTTNDLNKQNSPARQIYSDTRNMGKGFIQYLVLNLYFLSKFNHN